MWENVQKWLILMSHESWLMIYDNCMQQSFSKNNSIFASWMYPDGKLSSLKKCSPEFRFCSLDKKWWFCSLNLQNKFGCFTSYRWFAKWLLFLNFDTFQGKVNDPFWQYLRRPHMASRPENPSCSYNSQKAFCQNLVRYLNKCDCISVDGLLFCTGRHTRRPRTSVFVETIEFCF